MKLYYSPGACSLSPHIVLREAQIDFELERVHLGSKKTAIGADYKLINPKGSVPALEIDGGQILTEGPAIVQYIADRAPDKNLAPPSGTLARYRLQEWLNFVSTELHKGYSPLFRSPPEEWQAKIKETLAARLDFTARSLEAQTYLLGQDFTVADAYLFTVLRWSAQVGIDLARWRPLVAYVDRITARPAVRTALEVEGLSA